MRLSRRRYAFLETLSRMTRSSGGPVHYADVGREMGVSRWTAYDMMRELAKDDLVTPVYVRSERGYPGRSQVLFLATEKGERVLHSGSGVGELKEDWSGATRKTLQKLAVALAQGKGFNFFKSEMASDSPALFCAGVVAALITESRRRGLDLVFAGRLLNLSEIEAGPLIFVGFVAGGLILHGVARMIREIGPAVERFAEEVRSLKDDEKQALAGFVREVLGRAAST